MNFTTPNGPMTVALTLKKDGEKLIGHDCRPAGRGRGRGHAERQGRRHQLLGSDVKRPLCHRHERQPGWRRHRRHDGFRRTGAGGVDGKASRRRQRPPSRRRPPRRRRRATSPPTSRAPGPFSSTLAAMTGTPTRDPQAGRREAHGDVFVASRSASSNLRERSRATTSRSAFRPRSTGNAVKVTYTGTVDKDTMKGKVAFGDLGEGTFTGKKK